MYSRTYWVDHALSETNKFTITQVSGNVHTIVPYGTVMQQGVPQDANHFNNIEEAISAHEDTLLLLLNYARQNKWSQEEIDAALDASLSKLFVIDTGSVTLTNTSAFPFNNSQQSVAIAHPRDNANYIVVVDLVSSAGNVGEIEVKDKLTNGFKLSFTGSASSATINYKVIGGWNK